MNERLIISIKDNPTFATNKRIVNVDEIIVYGWKVVKHMRAWWKLFGQKYHITREQYKKHIPINELKDGDVIYILETEYYDRYFKNGKFYALIPRKIDLHNEIEKEN